MTMFEMPYKLVPVREIWRKDEMMKRRFARCMDGQTDGSTNLACHKICLSAAQNLSATTVAPLCIFSGPAVNDSNTTVTGIISRVLKFTD